MLDLGRETRRETLFELLFLVFLGAFLPAAGFFARFVWVVLLGWALAGRPRSSGPLDAPLLFFAVSQALSLWWAEDEGAALGAFTNTIVPLVGIAFAATSAIQSEERFHDAVTALALGLLPFSGYAVYQHFTGVARVSSYLENSNVFAMAVNLVLPVLIGTARKEALPPAVRALLALSAGLSTLAVLYSLGRGAWLAYLVAVAFLAWAFRSRELWAALGALVVSAPLLAESIASRAVSVAGPGGDSGRIAIWTATLRMIRDNPLLGVGYGNFEQVYLRYLTEWPSMRIVHAHNIFLNVWAETGLAGLAAFGWLVWMTLRTGWRLVRETRGGPWHGPAAGLLAAFLGFLTHNLVSDGLLSPPTFAGLALVVGLLQAVGALNRSIAFSTPSPTTASMASAARASASSTTSLSSLEKGDNT